MNNARNFYIGGAWVAPSVDRTIDVIDPATEQPICAVALGDAADVEAAVAAAKAAFPRFSRSTREERIALLQAVEQVYRERQAEIAAAISREMGAPRWLADQYQVGLGAAHLAATIATLQSLPFEERRGTTVIRREPVGVCALITPWNWPMNQICCKVFPALAAGCTVVLKPSELAPLNAILFAEVLHQAGVPPGVFNLVNGDGPTVGAALAAHPAVDMVSFTGSTRAGVQVARAAAETVKRVSQELGGKSPNILLDDADFTAAVTHCVQSVMLNSGQTCSAPTRLLVPVGRQREAVEIATSVAASMTVGDPAAAGTVIGPVVSRPQFEKIRRYIQRGIDEGATLACGGPGRPTGLETGYYVRPTVFSAVRNDMSIAREEIFGPVLCILPYDSDEQAIEIANDTEYGLAAYVSGRDPVRIQNVVERLRAGQVHVNGAPIDVNAPFGGYKRSGNGREWGEFGLQEFLEVKAVMNPAT